jgi:group II intron reverse transcriptase/maturase
MDGMVNGRRVGHFFIILGGFLLVLFVAVVAWRLSRPADERITSKMMQEAWRAVRRNRGAAGVDKVSIQMFEKNLEANLDCLMRELKKGTFVPLPARRVYIPKDAKQTKFRPLGIPAVRDRIAQEVLRRLLNPIFEAKFHDHSYGFRSGRGCHQAVEKVLELGQQGYRWVLDADISGFFDNLCHTAIMRELSDVVADGNILRLVEKFLRAGVMEGGKFLPTRVGTPQGGESQARHANRMIEATETALRRLSVSPKWQDCRRSTMTITAS